MEERRHAIPELTQGRNERARQLRFPVLPEAFNRSEGGTIRGQEEENDSGGEAELRGLVEGALVQAQEVANTEEFT